MPTTAPAAPRGSLPPEVQAKLKKLGVPIVPYDPRDLEAVVHGHKTLAELTGFPKKKQFELAGTAVKFLKDGLTDKALEILHGLEALDTYDAYVQVCLGSVAVENEELDQAEARFTKAISFNPASVSALSLRGEVRLRLGKQKEGQADLEAALKLDPKAEQDATARAKAILDAMKAPPVEAKAAPAKAAPAKPAAPAKAAPAKAAPAKKPAAKKK